MKKPRHHVTDHAVVRYLERVHGVDVEGLRRRIGRRVDLAVHLGASGAIVDGFVYRVEAGRVVTVAPHRQPALSTRRGKGKGGKK